jgi:NitT/TauT family transport system substrate-binding protein
MGALMRIRAGGCLFLAALFFIIALTGCDIGLTYEPPVRIITAPWIGYTPFYIARDRGLYGDMDVRIAEFGTDFDAARAAADGRAELTCGTFADFMRQRDQGVDLKIVAALDFSKGADGIVARPPIEDVAGLRGKRVAAEIGTLTHFVLLRALERAKVGEGEVTIVNIAMDEALAALEKGEVDAASLWEPFLSKAEKAGGKRVFSSAEIPGEILDVLAVPSDVLARRAGDIERVLRAWDSALGVIRREPEATLPIMAERLEMTVPELKESLTTIELIDLEQNARLFSRSGGGESAWDAYSRAASFMVQNKLVKSAPADPSVVLKPLFPKRGAAP